MNQEYLSKLLTDVKNGKLDVNAALEQLRDLTSKDLGYATIDNHRELRTGYPEVIFGQGKTPEQVAGIIQYMLTRDNNILATRVTAEMYDRVRELSRCRIQSNCPYHCHPKKGDSFSTDLYCRNYGRHFRPSGCRRSSCYC